MKTVTYKLDNVDCASCAMQIEERINALEGISFCSLDFMYLKLVVTFNDKLLTEEEIEENIHKSLSGVKILLKNKKEFNDEYKEEPIFKKILFRSRKK